MLLWLIVNIYVIYVSGFEFRIYLQLWSDVHKLLIEIKNKKLILVTYVISYVWNNYENYRDINNIRFNYVWKFPKIILWKSYYTFQIILLQKSTDILKTILNKQFTFKIVLKTRFKSWPFWIFPEKSKEIVYCTVAQAVINYIKKKKINYLSEQKSFHRSGLSVTPCNRHIPLIHD